MPSMAHVPFIIPIFLLTTIVLSAAAAAGVAVSPASSPRSAPPQSRPPPSPSSPLDPKQLLALHSLNIPTSKNPCTSPATVCDSSSPYSHLVSLSIANCSDDVALSVTALKSLSTLQSLAFINCPVSPIRFPPELTANLRSFTCINSLVKLTGVWLSRLQNVTELTVAGVSVNASGPSIILGGMKLLRSVTLSRCELGGSVPRHWHPNLTFIDLSNNRLKGKIPSAVTRLESLVHLNLSANSLNDSIPNTIGDLISLQNLSLASNTLSGPIPDSLAALPELTHLDLGSNHLDGAIPDFLKDMKKLRHLNLEKNNFHGVLPFNSSFIRNMEFFKVGGNSNLCYNRTILGPKVKLGIYPCDKHGKPILPPPSKDSTSDDSVDDDYSNLEQPKRHSGPSKVVLGVAIGLSSIVFLIVFLVCLSKCCR